MHRVRNDWIRYIFIDADIESCGLLQRFSSDDTIIKILIKTEMRYWGMVR